MRKNLDRLVWTILIAAFSLFCAILIGVPLGVRAYLFSARVDLPATLETISGTVLAQGPRDPEPIGVVAAPDQSDVTRLRDVKPGSVITTDSTSRAILTFQSADSEDEVVLSTVQLYHDTRVTIEESKLPRYAISPQPGQITLKVDSGQVRIATTHFDKSAPTVEVITPHSRTNLSEGSYSFWVTNALSEVVVRFGGATVEAQNQSVDLTSGQRTDILVNESPQAALPAAQNLIVNGNFINPLEPSWQTDTFEAVANAEIGKAEIVTTAGRKAIFLSRMGEDGIHSEVGISQVINRDVLDFESLVLRLDAKLLHQSLAGGGYLSSEFPIMVRIDYKDIYGIDRFWIQGFYYQNVDNYPIQDSLWGLPLGQQIPHAVWYPYESDNLLTVLGDIRPARIHSIRIYASGWNFQSMIAEVGLIAE